MSAEQNDELDFESSREEELKKIKTWLFRENIRIQNEKAELENMRQKLIEDRVTFRNEMNILNNRMTVEQKKLREETQFIEKKMEIIKEGFRKLDYDRKSIENEKRALEIKRKQAVEYCRSIPDGERVVEIMFRGCNDAKSNQKRYRELLKIFHPDNNDGDLELVQWINEEYIKRKDKY